MNTLNLNLCGYSIEVTSNDYNTVTKWGAQRFEHDIKVKVNGQRFSFKFYTSVNDFEQGNDTVNLQEALHAFFSDAAYFSDAENIHDFAAQLGYDMDNQAKEAKQVFSACEKSHNTLNRIFGDDFYNVYNALTDLENEQ
jgi:hypothetical protein